MSADNKCVDRRTVLRRSSLGLAAVLGLGTTGATAANFQPGTCVVAAESTSLWEYGCPPAGYLITVPASQPGVVTEVCDRPGGYVKVDWGVHEGWVTPTALTTC